MSTQAWTTRIRHDDDATYQEWRDELITKLNLLSEMVADETTVVAATGTRPSTNTEESYAVYHLADSLHGSAPIYIRFGFGTGSQSTAPRIQVTAGTSTNGSGVLGGTCLTTIRNIQQSGTTATSDTTRPSYMSSNEGFFGLSWKNVDGNTGQNGFFVVCRTCDNTGTPTVTGAMIIHGAGQGSLAATQAMRYAATAVAFTAQTVQAAQCLGFNPQARAASTVGADTQFFLGWTITPAVSPLFAIGGLIDAEYPMGNTFTATLVGSTPRTFIALNSAGGTFSHTNGSSGPLKYGMLWE